MSRSFKRTPGWTDHGRNTYQDKRLASKAVRRAVHVANGGAYKRYYSQWSICDWVSLYYHDAQLNDYLDHTGDPRYRAIMK